MNQRWCIYIDIEGFGANYEKDNTALLALGDLMEGIYRIGVECYPKRADRIFAHQTGDGFAIVSEYGCDTLEVPISIAIALLRQVSPRGRFAKAALAEGGFADITGCYPECVRDAQDANGHVSMGDGLLTLFPVMGTALINAVSLMKKSPSGALFTMAASNHTRFPQGCVVQAVNELELLSVDWVHSCVPKVSEIQRRAGLRTPSADELKARLVAYFNSWRL